MWWPHSPDSDDYNCIAWALGIQDRGLWPWGDWDWPRAKPEVVTIQEFIDVFRLFGFEKCGSWIFEAGSEKIALYVRGGEVNHAARQLPDGRWTSKLGRGIDIVHEGLADFPTDAPYGPCTFYGGAEYFFKRRLDVPHPDYQSVVRDATLT